MNIMRAMFVQRFEPRGRRFTNFHYYYYYVHCFTVCCQKERCCNSLPLCTTLQFSVKLSAGGISHHKIRPHYYILCLLYVSQL